MGSVDACHIGHGPCSWLVEVVVRSCKSLEISEEILGSDAAPPPTTCSDEAMLVPVWGHGFCFAMDGVKLRARYPYKKKKVTSTLYTITIRILIFASIFDVRIVIDLCSREPSLLNYIFIYMTPLCYIVFFF